MITAWRSLLAEPRPADVPPVGRLDRLIVVGFVAVVLLEGTLRPHLTWRPLVIVLALALAPALLRRRTDPLAACLASWGIAGLLSVLQLLAHANEVGLQAMVAVVVLLFSLVRWGSGREVALGAAFVVVVAMLGMSASSAGRSEILDGSAFLLACGAMGAVFRYRAEVRRRQQREIRAQERVALARELHDIVAHHVSAIAVQAQAGGVVVDERPDKAAEILAAIGAEASRTLAEMRSMVRVLRDGESGALAPQRGLADLPALARRDRRPIVEVAVTGDVSLVPPAVDAVLYRIAQESLTNAVRHAREATRVDIGVRREGGVVVLRVSDDGRPPSGSPRLPGFGLQGMSERAQLLGGSLTAGPGPERGWVVEAVLPAAAVR